MLQSFQLFKGRLITVTTDMLVKLGDLAHQLMDLPIDIIDDNFN